MVQIRTMALGGPCLEEVDPWEAALARKIRVPAWLPRLCLDAKVFCIVVLCLCAAPCNSDLGEARLQIVLVGRSL